MKNSFDYTQLFLQKYVYILGFEKNWSKTEQLLSNIPDKVILPEIILKTLLLRSKLELGKTKESKELVEYCINNLDRVSNIECAELLDIILCNIFDYSFRVLVNEGLYSKIDSNEETAMFACMALNKVSLYDVKTYRSHIINIFSRLKKAKLANTSFTSNYIMAGYYMIMSPFKTKLLDNINSISRKLENNADCFIFND